jgi:predicted ATPase/DNA-binding CsgD family transcriptional regulator
VTQCPNNLPIELTSFVGRRAELRQVGEVLGTARLLTLTGAGGCGKTRLALQAADDALDDHADGVWWVDLARLEDPELLPGVVIAAIGLREAPARAPLDTLVDHLRERGALLVLDNCEHLLAACAQLADALLRPCPSLTILATSRALLSIPGETAWRVPSMSLPDKIRRDPIETLDRSDAARLFADRVMQVRPTFAITAANAPAIAQICHDLDGIPLALELGAARARILTPEQIALGLADRFHLLTGGSHTVIPRHQTLQASLDWSHELLDERERTLLRRLSVFAGGWTLDAAEDVCAGDAIDRHGVLDLLSGLYDNSLVTTHQQGSEFRYGLLETVRQYAAARLAEAGEVEELRDRHLAYHLALAERSEPEMLGAGGDDPVLRRLTAALPNLRAALEWAAASDPQAALRLAVALTLFWPFTGRYREGDAAYARALSAEGDEPTALRGRVLCGRASLGVNGGARDQATRWAQAALEIGRAHGDLGVEARACETLGVIALLGDDAAGAQALLERSLELACMAGDDHCRVDAAQMLGWCLNLQDEFDIARPLFDEAYPIASRLGYRSGIAWYWLSRGRHAMLEGRLDESHDCFERCVAAAQDIGEPVTRCYAQANLVFIDVWRGNAHDARALARQTLELAVETGAGRVVGRGNEAVARTELALGELTAARRHLKAAVEAEGTAYHAAEQLAALGTAERIAGHIDAARDRAEEALAIARRMGSGWLQAQAEGLLGRLALAEADVREAERSVHAGLQRLVAKRFALGMPDCLDALAAVAVARERFSEAARLLGAGAAGRARLGIVRWHPEAHFWSGIEQATREALGRDAYHAAYAEGAALELDEAVAYARRARGARSRPKRGWDSLTPTELRVVELAAQGLTNPQIAERMFISRATAKSHLSHIYAKTGISSRSELAAEAMRRTAHSARSTP